MRAKETLAMKARWQDCDRDVMVVFYGSTGSTADLPDVARNLGEFFRARGAMKAVDILRNQPKFLEAPLKFRNGNMGRIRGFGCDQLAPPIVPFPHEPRIPREGFRGGKVFRAEIPPQALGPPKRRHAAIR